jgi:hypothetical protein
MTRRSAIKRAASVTLFASIPRAAKYPRSDAFADRGYATNVLRLLACSLMP